MFKLTTFSQLLGYIILYSSRFQYRFNSTFLSRATLYCSLSSLCINRISKRSTLSNVSQPLFLDLLLGFLFPFLVISTLEILKFSCRTHKAIRVKWILSIVIQVLHFPAWKTHTLLHFLFPSCLVLLFILWTIFCSTDTGTIRWRFLFHNSFSNSICKLRISRRRSSKYFTDRHGLKLLLTVLRMRHVRPSKLLSHLQSQA